MCTKITERFGGGTIPVALRISPGRSGGASRASRRCLAASDRGCSSLGIIAPVLPVINPAYLTTKTPGAARDPDLCGGTFDGQAVPTPKKSAVRGRSPEPKREASRMDAESLGYTLARKRAASRGRINRGI